MAKKGKRRDSAAIKETVGDVVVNHPKKKSAGKKEKFDGRSLGTMRDDSLMNIIDCLGCYDCYLMAQVSKRFEKLIFSAKGDEAVWKRLCITEAAAQYRLLDGRDEANIDSEKVAAAAKDEAQCATWVSFYRHMSSKTFLAAQPFHGVMNRPQVELELSDKPTGTYLVRPSSQSVHDYVISANFEGRVLHHLVVCVGQRRGFMLLGKLYNTMFSLLDQQKAVALVSPLKLTGSVAEEMAKAKTQIEQQLKELKKGRGKQQGGAAADRVQTFGALLRLACEWALPDSAAKLVKEICGNKGPGKPALSAADAHGRTPLHFAVRPRVGAVIPVSPAQQQQQQPLQTTDLAPTVRLLLDNRADADAVDQSGDTPLLRLLERTAPPAALVNMLLAHGCDVDAAKNGKRALHVATARGHLDAVRALLDMGRVPADQPTTDDDGGQTALHVAAQYGRKPVMELLLERGVSVNVEDGRQRTPVHAAVIADQDWIGLHMFGRPFRTMYNFQVVLWLVEHGADLHLRDGRGRTVLHWACEGGHRSVSKVLLDSGARWDVKDKDGQTAEQLVSLGRSHANVLEARRRMELLVFQGMQCDLDAFSATIDSHFDQIKEAIAEAKSTAAASGATKKKKADSSTTTGGAGAGKKKGRKSKSKSEIIDEDASEENETGPAEADEKAASKKSSSKNRSSKSKKGKSAK